MRILKTGYLRNLELCLNYRWLAVGVFAMFIVGTAGGYPSRPRFIPPLEEGHLWIRAIFPVSVSLPEVSEHRDLPGPIMRKYPQVESVVNSMGRPDSGTDPIGFYSSEFFVPLRPQEHWQATVPTTGWRRWFADNRPPTKPELIQKSSAEFNAAFPGVNWNFSQVIRDNVLEVCRAYKGENSVKILGPDLDELENSANEAWPRWPTYRESRTSATIGSGARRTWSCRSIAISVRSGMSAWPTFTT